VRYDGFVAHTVFRQLAALILAAAGGGAAAYDSAVATDAIAAAIRLGESRVERVRADFHTPYRIDVRRPPIDYVDLVTPFRRIVLAAEERMRAGGRAFRQQEAQAVLAVHGNTLEVFVELTFHPQNTYVGVPAYEVELRTRGPQVTALPPLRVERVPRSGPRLETGPTRSPYPTAPQLPAGGQPVVGGTVIASFDGSRLDPQGTYDLVIREGGKELARASVALASVR
jgi:hypothetical protein